jgi:GNAT superfamily N-acetyltransferase
MLFASTELAARVERAEARLIADAARAIAEAAPGSPVLLREISGGVAAYTGDGMPFNKIAGLGFGGPLAEDELTEVEEVFAARGADLQVEVSILGDPGICRALTGRGYVLAGFENVLGRTLPAGDAVEPAPGIGLERVPADGLDEWIDVVVVGFAHADEQGVPAHESFDREPLERAIRGLARAAGMRHYLVRRDGAAAGGGSMRICDGVAQLSGAATLPEHRRRGIQSLLLSWRLADAAAAGCDLAVVTTQPGSKSHQNVQRRGFELLYSRAVLVRELRTSRAPSPPSPGT